MLTLPVKKKWFDMMLRGVKQEEYREIKPYYDTRFVKWLGFPTSEIEDVKDLLRQQETLNTKEICFRNGYSKNSSSFTALCSLAIKEGRKEWGAEPRVKYYTLIIHKIIKRPEKEQEDDN